MGTYDGSTQKLFVNGVLVDSQSSNIGNANWNETCWTSIGGDGLSASGCSGGYTSIEGKLDNIQIWDFALTQLDIEQYMCMSLTGNESGLVGYWNFEEGSGNTVYDQTSNGNNGTINGATYDMNIPLQLCSLTNSNGCDSTAVLNLTINSSDSTNSLVTACDSYTWDGVVYSTSGVYSNTYTNASGCDSVHTLNLTINYSNTGTSSATSCDSYTWYGVVYTTSGVYSNTYHASGCEWIILILANTCDSYTWDGIRYKCSRL